MPKGSTQDPREVLRRSAVIRVAQRAGIPLAEIREALESLPNERTPTAGDCIGCGCLSVETCTLRTPWDELGEHGAGPRLLSDV